MVLDAMLLVLLLGRIGLTSGEIRIGGALNLFRRYGYLSISMRVAPRSDSDAWVFREPIVDVFQNVTATRQIDSDPSNPLLHGDFHLEFCDDITQLLEAYFRQFTIEKLERPWQAFTGCWSEATLARNLGLNSTYVSGNYSYVLVRLSRYRVSASLTDSFLPDSVKLHDPVAAQADRVNVGDEISVAQFIGSFGTHFVTSYSTGNSLYQVIVFSPLVYNTVKHRLFKSIKEGDTIPSWATTATLFSPMFAEHFGLILSASGNSTVAQWAKNNLRMDFLHMKYYSLLKIHGKSYAMKEVSSLLGNEALLQLHLSTLAPVFKDKEKRNWFEEVIDNNLKLYEFNMV